MITMKFSDMVLKLKSRNDEDYFTLKRYPHCKICKRKMMYNKNNKICYDCDVGV